MLVHPDVVAVALDRAEGSVFERFANEFMPAITGNTYAPLGGMHDGGADAFGGDPVFERIGGTTSFYQASVQEDFRAKIRSTIKRLIAFGRSPQRLTYITSRSIQYIDAEEELLSDETGVTIRIHDLKYIVAHVNDNPSTRGAFDNHLRHLTDFLKQIGSSSIVHNSVHVRSSAVFVFLRQELDRRSGDDSLVYAVVDSLILWALEGTDPDVHPEVLMNAAEVEAKILETVPSARDLLKKNVSKRLKALAKKDYPGGRQVRWYTKKSLFCLPFETRARIEDENLEDEALRLHVLNGMYSRAQRDYPDVAEITLRRSAEISLRSLQLVFEREGLALSNFVTGGGRDVEPPTLGDAVRDAIGQEGLAGVDAIEMARVCIAVARGCLYQSTDQERGYLGKLARTYALLFTVKNEPKLVEYFQEMAADFVLFVGADLIVRALSEQYLERADQVTRNTLLITARAGAKLVLTEAVVDEVVNHLRTTDYEFKNYFAAIEHRVDNDLAMNAPKILIRTYFYARLGRSGAKRPKSWDGFINQFCDYSNLHHASAYIEIRRYLQGAFSMEYWTNRELGELVDVTVVNKIAGVLEQRKQRKLAENDALLACAVYGRRRLKREHSRITEFGYQTWWLTNETTILRYTNDLLNDNDQQPYMMRPDFLLNFLTFAPAASDARSTFRNVFPNPLGIKLSRRMDEDAFHKMMKDVGDAESLDDSRRKAAMASAVDRLKSDFDKRYHFELDDAAAVSEPA